MHRLPQHSLEPLPSGPATKLTPALRWRCPGHHLLVACRAWTFLSRSSKALGDTPALGGTSAAGTGAALCRFLRAQSWGMPGNPCPVLPWALFPASLCGNSSNLRCRRNRVDFFSTALGRVLQPRPTLLQAQRPFCYFQPNFIPRFTYLIIPLFRASSASPSPRGQPDGDVQVQNEDISSPAAQTDPAGWDPLVPRCPLPAAPSLQQQCHGLAGIPIARGPSCSTSPGR